GSRIARSVLIRPSFDRRDIRRFRRYVGKRRDGEITHRWSISRPSLREEAVPEYRPDRSVPRGDIAWEFAPGSSIPGLLRGNIGEEALHRRSERRDIVPDRSPDDRSVDPEIGMDQLVTHTGHFAPGKRGVSFPDLMRNAFRRLTDHFQCSCDRIDCL